MRWLGGIVLALALAAPSCSEEPLGEGHYRWEGIHGFAIWPEDHPEDALAACEEKLDEEPWRGDPGATAEEFVTSVLNWREPGDLEDHDVPEDAPRTVFTMLDGSMPNWALGVVVHLRQLRGCWFVAAVWPREGDIAGDYRWIERDGGYELRATWKGSDPINFEVGWGGQREVQELQPGESVAIAAPDPPVPGHVLWFDDSPSEGTFGQPLSPPPRIP